MTYSLRQFGHMVTDPVRIEAYMTAITATVRPGDTVIDVGAGTGFFALLACQAGAAHVWAVDPDPMIELGPVYAQANGFGDRITFVRGFTQDLELPAPVDVVVGDVRGRLPAFEITLDTYRDINARLLKPGGRIVPERDHLFVAPLSDADHYRREVVEPWQTNVLGLDLGGTDEMVADTMTATLVEEPSTLLDPQRWLTLDYVTAQRTNVQALSFTADRAFTAHFLALWFDTELTGGAGFSNAPGGPRPQVYGQTLLPLAQPVELAVGDRLETELTASCVSGDVLYSWRVSVVRADGSVERLRRQSTFNSLPMSALTRRAGTFVPTLSDEGRSVGVALRLIGSGSTLSEAATALREEFPGRFPSPQSALTLVADISARYAL